MQSVAVEAFVIDDINEEKSWSHGFTREDVLEALGNRRVVIRNRKDRAADYLLIGRDDRNRYLTIPILPKSDR
jgi:hypothetical protein